MREGTPLFNGEKLAMLRIACDMTQQELADKIGEGVSKCYISMLETGKATPSPERMSIICTVLGVEQEVLKG